MSSDDARTAVAQAVAAWPEDARASMMAAADAIQAHTPAYDDPPPFADHDRERATAEAERVRRGGPDDTYPDLDALAALPAADAGRLAADLVGAGRMDMLGQVVVGLAPGDLPVAAMLGAAAALPADSYQRAALIRAAAASPARELIAGIAEAAGQATDPAPLLAVVGETAATRQEMASGRPYRWWREPEMSMAEPPDDGPGEMSDEMPGEMPGETPGETSGEMPEAIPGETEVVLPESPPGPPPGPPTGQPTTRTAYPRLDVETGTTRPDVVVIDQEFEVTIGLQKRRSTVGVDTGMVTLAMPADGQVDLEAMLLFDPTSIEVTGSPRTTLTVTDLNLYPEQTFQCVAKYGEDLAPERRLGVQLLRDGQVVAVAWRTLVAVDEADRVEEADVPESRERELLDLGPLLGAEPPDLVVSICASDAGAETYVWTAFSVHDDIVVPDLPSTTTLPADDKAGFATLIRRFIQSDASAGERFLELAGRAQVIGDAIPQGIRQALAAAVGRVPGTPPAVLLLTEELDVPWELAAVDLPGASGRDVAPFLGAHAAISRWPLSDHKPRPTPRSSVRVSAAAVLTADYSGVQGFPVLASAQAEAVEVAALFQPPAQAVAPELWTVVDLLRGQPPCELLHVALHGKFDDQSTQEGIVLLEKDAASGTTKGRYLTPTMLENGALQLGPFVFLNACQVGADERVLGNYAGFASTLLRIGATGVVAPLWNVRDDVAAHVAEEFYAAAWHGTNAAAPDAVPVAEAVRRLRATYTEKAVHDGEPMADPTLIAYQVFGHPRLRLTGATP